MKTSTTTNNIQINSELLIRAHHSYKWLEDVRIPNDEVSLSYAKEHGDEEGQAYWSRKCGQAYYALQILDRLFDGEDITEDEWWIVRYVRSNKSEYAQAYIHKILMSQHKDWQDHTLQCADEPKLSGEYILTQEAYMDGSNEAPYYTALALRVEEEITADGELNYYRVYWEPIEGWEDEYDASLHCDWHRPSRIEHYGAI